MKTLIFVSLMSVMGPVFAQPINPMMCARILGIPNEHAGKFGGYSNLNALTPLTHEFTNANGFTYLHLRNIIPHNVGDRPFKNLEVEVLYGFDPEARNAMSIEGVTMSDGLAPTYTFRVILAHLLKRYNFVNQIRYDVFDAADNGLLKEQLAEGAAPEHAVRSLPSYAALEDYGFELDQVFDTTETRDDEAYRGDVHVSYTVRRRQ